MPHARSCSTTPAPRAARLLRAALLLLLVALSGCAWLVEKQNMLALRPTPGQPAGFSGLRPGDQKLLVGMDDDGQTQQLALWWLPHRNSAAPTLLYLHGTFRNLYQNLPKIDALRDAGFAIVAVDYRGWGDSTPIVPSERTVLADARRAWQEVVRRQPDPRRRVIYGHSMGGSVAVILASELHNDRDYGALALESTFTSIPDVAAAAGFWGRVGAALTTLRFDAGARIGAVDAPIWMLHGTHLFQCDAASRNESLALVLLHSTGTIARNVDGAERRNTAASDGARLHLAFRGLCR